MSANVGLLIFDESFLQKYNSFKFSLILLSEFLSPRMYPKPIKILILCIHAILFPICFPDFLCQNSDKMCVYNGAYAGIVQAEALLRATFAPEKSPPGNSPAPSPRYSVMLGGTPDFFPRERIGTKESFGLVGIIIGVTLGIIAAIIFTITVSYLKRRSSRGGANEDIEKFLFQHGSLATKRYKYSEIKKITKSFNDKLGRGGYGSVYKGMLPDGCLVAVKVLNEINSNGEEFVNEVASISKTSHVNIVNLLGFCYDRNKRALVYEFMPNMSLDKFISISGSDNEGCQLDVNKLYKIAVGVARGLEYLHTGCNTRIVHFDIKPQNILLDEDFCPKISDFGLAKLCKKQQSVLSSMLGTRGTIGYIAPEIFSRNYGGASYKSDVYSYGMMLLKMAGEKIFVETKTTQSTENYFPDKIYEHVRQAVTRNFDDFMVEEEEEKVRKLFLVGFWCIQTAPSDRPSMSKVLEMLEGSLQSIPIPPKPVLFTPVWEQEIMSSSMPASTKTENVEESSTSLGDLFRHHSLQNRAHIPSSLREN